MLLSGIPTKFQIAFASAAGPGFITTPIPAAAQPNGRASLATGFAELNFDPLASGGIPPWGADFNGLLFQITQWLQWAAAGGFPVSYDSSFATSIGGYPQYALLRKASGDRYWLSQVDNNLVNPEAGASTSWALFPDVIVQKQAGNYATDTGAINAFQVTLTPLPASLASIIGAPIRVVAAHANSIVNPKINIVNTAGDLPVTMINSNGSPLLISQIARAGQIFEGFFDGTFFQVTTPAPIQAAGPGNPVVQTGVIYEWPAEVPPSWGLECNGALPLIASFPNLFNIIGTRFGGDGVNTFGLPDKRGAFTRGWDHGRGLDPNATTRTRFFNSGGVVGDHVGSWQNYLINGNGLTGARIIVTGDPNLPGTQGPIVDPFTGITTYSIGTRGPDRNVLGGAGYADPNWYTLSGPFANPSFFQGQGAEPANSSQGLGPQSVWELGGVLASVIGPGAETRPLNIDMMYVIAF